MHFTSRGWFHTPPPLTAGVNNGPTNAAAHHQLVHCCICWTSEEDDMDVNNS